MLRFVAGVRWADARQGRRGAPVSRQYGRDRGRRLAPHRAARRHKAHCAGASKLAAVFLTRLGVPKLWRGDPEALWPHFLRPYVAPFVSYLTPASGYGLDRVPVEGGGVIAANHLSAIDPPLVGMLCPRTIYFMAKAELLAVPVIGEALAWTGAFSVRRGEGDRDSLREARRLVAEGHMVGVFIEGTRQKFGYPGPVLPGGMMIALQEEAPIVPCGVYSFGWSRRNRMPSAVVWGEPIDVSGLPRSGRGYREAADIVRAEVLRLWRLAGDAVSSGFPDELPDGAHRATRGDATKLALAGRSRAPQRV
jgi:1-acyl-sn-glycerol-3-phosphate acyltransferase